MTIAERNERVVELWNQEVPVEQIRQMFTNGRGKPLTRARIYQILDDYREKHGTDKVRAYKDRTECERNARIVELWESGTSMEEIRNIFLSADGKPLTAGRIYQIIDAYRDKYGVEISRPPQVSTEKDDRDARIVELWNQEVPVDQIRRQFPNAHGEPLTRGRIYQIIKNFRDIHGDDKVRRAKYGQPL